MKITPVALIADGRQIARFGDARFESPWFTAPVRGLARKRRDWLADVSRFNVEMEAAKNDAALWHRRLAELKLTEGDLTIFSTLSVQFSDKSVHRIGSTVFEDGTLRWRNGQELTGETAAFAPSFTLWRGLVDFCKGILEQFVVHVIGFGLIIAGLAAWSAGWFG